MISVVRLELAFASSQLGLLLLQALLVSLSRHGVER